MAKAKYKQYFEQMMEENQEIFDRFRPVHEQYKLNQEANQDKFNDIGQEVVELIRDWERRLCAVMGRSKYSKYAQQVSEKFWNLVRAEFDQIDMVGVKISHE